MASARQPVLNVGRLLTKVLSFNKAVTFELPKLLRQDLLSDTWYVTQKLRATH